MEKEFIPYEQALDLKELGFDEPCFFPYNKEGEICWNEKVFHNIQYQRYDFPIFDEKSIHYIGIRAPLYQQAFRWFREKYNCHHTIHQNKKYVGIAYSSVVNFSIDEFDTYEEAELACLKKLIEIIKNKTI